MIGTVKKIDPPKISKRGMIEYKRIHIELEDGNWAMTDIISTFRNYQYWEPVIEFGVGAILDGLILLGKSKINADSPVKIIGKKLL